MRGESWLKMRPAFHLRPSTLAGRFQSSRPPEQVVDHHSGLLVQLGEVFVYVPALEMRPKRRNWNADG